MARRLKLNRELVMRDLDPDIGAVVDEILPNLDAAANRAVKDFRQDVAKRIEAFEKHDYAGELAAAVEEMEDQLEEAMQPILDDIAEIAKLSKAAMDVWDDEHGNIETFKKKILEAEGKRAALEEKMNGFREKVRNAGKTGAKFIIGGVKRMVFG